MGMFDEKSPLAECMDKQLALEECKLEDGSQVSNLEGICQMLIGKALNGDIQAVDFISKLTEKKGKK
jgi:hypothetical protein